MWTTINSMANDALSFFTILAASGPDFSGLSSTIILWLNAFLIPVFVIIGGISIFKLISLGWKIAHSADIPDERKLAIQGVIWWAIGLALCIAAPILVNTLVPILIKNSSGYNPGK